MKLLLSNDDGVHAPGLRTLAGVLGTIADIRVVAPDRDHSGASNSLTLTRPLKVQEVGVNVFSVDGTPTDCVHLGMTNLFDLTFDRVVSGINTHANLGDDVLYSGTVAAAMEGRFLGKPAIAVSLVNNGGNHYETAAQIVLRLLSDGVPELPGKTILNVNVPDVPLSEIRGIRITRLGHRERGEPPQKIVDPRGHTRYWIGAAGAGHDAGEGTDFHAVEHGYVSITPLQTDMTHYKTIKILEEWRVGVN